MRSAGATKVSIITPSYNQGEFIERTIQSVLNQSYSNIEYIIVDGGSTDNTPAILNNYKDHIDKIIHEKDNGQSDAINKGFKISTGKLLGWVNSDDELYRDCVENIVDLFNNNPEGSIFYGSKLNFINREGALISCFQREIKDRYSLLNHNYDIIQQGSFYKREAIERVGFLNESLHYSLDLDLWLKLLYNGTIFSFDKYPLAAFRIWEGSKTVNSEINFLKEIRRTLRYHQMYLLSNNHRKLLLSIARKKIKFFIKRK